jgi:SH3-like domain-containing protein
VNKISPIRRLFASLLALLLPLTAASDDFSDAVAAYANSDYEKAYQLWRPLAESGNLGAMFDLGVLYWEGQGTPRNRSLAIQWWQQAAQRNVAAAQYNLSLAYYLGAQIEQDTYKALTLARLAAEQDHDYATRVLPILEQDLAVPTEPTDIRFAYSGASVGETRANLYAGRNTATAVLDTLEVGTPIRVLSSESSWSRIEIPGGILVWVFGQYVTPVGAIHKISGTGVRARTAPTTDKSSSVVGVFAAGTTIEVVATKNDWNQIRAPSSIPVWIPTHHVQITKEITEEWREGWAAANARRAAIRAALEPVPQPVALATKTLPENSTTKSLTVSEAHPAFRPAMVSAKVAEVVGAHETDAQLLKLLTRDTPVRITEEHGTWAKVEVPTGLYVWVYGKYLSETASQSFINTDNVRARSLPSNHRDSSVLGIFSKGTNVVFISRQGDWKRIKAYNSVAGWMQLNKLTVLNIATEEWQAKWSEYR